jgi:hypothetical protein
VEIIEARTPRNPVDLFNPVIYRTTAWMQEVEQRREQLPRDAEAAEKIIDKISPQRRKGRKVNHQLKQPWTSIWKPSLILIQGMELNQ